MIFKNLALIFIILITIGVISYTTVDETKNIDKNSTENITPKNYVDAIEIKGIYFGMPQVDFYKKFGEPPTSNIVYIAGIEGQAQTYFENKFLEKFVFIFESQNFESILESVKNKYPQMLCDKGMLQNKMGATFQQVECLLNDKTGNLYLVKYAGGNISKSILQLIKKSHLDQIKIQQEKSKKDI